MKRTLFIALFSFGCASTPQPEASPPIAPAQRPPMDVWPVALERLPIATLPLRFLDPARSSKENKPLASDVTTEPRANAAPGAHRLYVTRDLMTLWLGQDHDGAREYEVVCGPLADTAVLHSLPASLRWERLRRTSRGVTLEITDGWLDHATCEVSIEQTTSIDAAPIVPGLLYAFRSQPFGRDYLELIFPASATYVATQPFEGRARGATAIGRARFPLEGDGFSFMATAETDLWLKSLGARDTTDLGTVLIGLEVTQTTTEDVALAIAYRGAPKPEMPTRSSRQTDYVFED